MIYNQRGRKRSLYSISTLRSDQVSGSSRNLQAIATIDRDLHGNNILKTKRQGN